MDEKKKTGKLINWVVRPLVWVAVFVAAFLISSAIFNRGGQDMIADMESCTFPTITVGYKDMQLNRMYGYADALAAGGDRGSLTLLDEEHKLPIQVQTFGTQVNAIRYQVRSLDMERLIEDTEVKEFEEVEDCIDVRLNIQDLLSDNQDYQLIIELDTEVDSDIFYYTRIRKDGAFYAQESIQFAQNFHEKSCAKDTQEELVRYLESNSLGDNSSFAHVNIHSNYDMVKWGSLNIVSIEDVDVSLQEINAQTACITMDYMLVLQNSSEELEHYYVTEYYRIRYTKERTYLLDFDRTMNQFFEMDHKVIYSTAIQLGIVNSDVDFKQTEDGRNVSFVQEGELFAYQSKQHSMSKIFGFWTKDRDVRYRNNQHQIQIIDVDEDGGTDFVVYGYMPRGVHEGKVGVSVCRYDSNTNFTEEYAFIEYDKDYQMLNEDVSHLLYLNENRTFYIHLQNNLYEIDMNTRKINKLAENMKSDEFAVASDNTLLVLQKEEDLRQSEQLTYIDLQEGVKKKVSCGENERIRPLGFIGRDLVYGVARLEDISEDANGDMIFPMYKIEIVDSNGKIKKDYEPSGLFVTQYRIEENILHMTRVSKSGTGYSVVDEDQLIYSQSEDDSTVILKSITTESKKREYQLDFGFSMPTKEMQMLNPKEVILDNKKNIVLEKNEKRPVYFYVYAKGVLDGVYMNVAEAIARADSLAGVVVNQNQEYIWERVSRQTEYQISGMETITTQMGYSSVEASLLSICHYYGNGADVSSLLAQGLMPVQVLQQALGEKKVVNFTGATLEQALYCVNRGYPILAAVPDGQYVVLVGYNALNTIVMDPVAGKTGYMGMNDSRTAFEAAGNNFIVCLP